MTKIKKRVAVGMSGGVDSSVTAARLLEQGYDVLGITLDLLPEWARPEGESNAVADARKVAEKLGIEHHVLYATDLFEEAVILPFARTYAQGLTPNPCVNCNVVIKFGHMLAFAREHGCDFLATGHYARLVDANGTLMLARPEDGRKDQTYFLWRVDPALYSMMMFPLADTHKTDTFAYAEKLGLHVAHKAESQDICFTCTMDHRAIVERLCRDAQVPGPIIDDEGKVRGEHNGLYHYTIGQRKGLGVGGLEKPYYVYEIDARTNTVRIGPRDSLRVTHLRARDAHLNGHKPGDEIKCQVMLRYNMKPVNALVKYSEGSFIDIELEEPVYGIAAGQSAVCYQQWGDYNVVVGGGIILCVN